MRAAFTPGEAFAGYRVEGLVGRGGMGVVLRAHDPRLQRSVALKLIAPELAEDRRFRERFLTESRLAASLDHPNVVPIHAAGEHDGQLYLAMRLVEGSDLKTVLAREGSVPPERTIDVLGQIAGALDAAHRRGLVHRDVKPANVLLDEDCHAYLTDFGLTLAAGAGDATAGGRVPGTLDYLAPEQIRGEEIDARTDQYALACVLYECLAGVPPFRRATVAETLWAHLHEAPPELSAQGALEPVLERGLAKGMEERYSTCGELVVAASEALGLEPPLRRARRARGARLLVAGGLLGLVVALAAAVLVGSSDEPTVARAITGVAPNSVAVLDPRTGRIERGIGIPGRPSIMASRGRSVWVANDDARTVAALDARAMTLRKVVPAAVGASDIATSPDAVWLVDAIRHELVRMDAAYGNVTNRLPLRGDPRLSRPGVDVGFGAVWASDGANGLLELDPLDGHVRRRIDVGRSLDHLAAGEGAVWAIESGAAAVVRIDPMRGSIRTIPIEGERSASPAPIDITTGHGAVWVLNANIPSVTRIDPRRGVVSDTVGLGVGSNPSEIAAGAGAVWVALAGESSLARISPDGGHVGKLRVGGSPVGVTVASGRVFASVQPGFRALPADRGGRASIDGAVEEPFCGPVEYEGPGRPELVIVSDLPLQLPRSSQQPLQFTDAIRVVLARRGFRAGRHQIGYQSCDDSNVETGQARADPWTPQTCRTNARAYVRAPAVVGVIGPFSSSCATSFIPVVNRAPGGALATISATATAVGLTNSGPGALPREPDAYYPSGVRNFARVVASDNLQGAAAAVMAKKLGLKRLFMLTDGSSYGVGVAKTAARAAKMLGIEIAGPVRWDPQAARYRDLAQRVERSGADGVFLGGYHFTGGSRVLRDLRATLDPRVRILAPDGFSEFGAVVEAVGAAAEGLIVTIATLPPERQPPAGRRFTASFGRAVGGPVDPYSVTTAQAVDVLLDAISASDGTRASVTEALLEVDVENGILGDFGFDANGDTTSAAVSIYEIEGGRERVRATITPPARLIAE